MFNFLPGSGVFALAGLIAAAGPVLIHLLNRRRFRVLNWAAMDFLREALERNRRMLHLRDLLLMALRTLCVLLFGLALARPFLSRSNDNASINDPVHAVLVVDNSLSMGYDKLDHTVLEDAKHKARDFLDDMPSGSRVSVLPLCGSAGSFSFDAYRTKEDASDALARIEVVDRPGNAAQAADLARQALAQVPDLHNKRVAFIGDQQLIDWPNESLADQLRDLPELQVVSVAASEPENTWVEDFSVLDGIADVETPAVFSATIRHAGPAPRNNVQVVLSVDGTEVGSETVDLSPGQSRIVSFKYRPEVSVEPGKAVFLPAKVSIPPDHLPEDDFRVLCLPVVAALPVVFVDQYGSDEDPQRNRYGETRLLRRWFAPHVDRGDAPHQLIEVRHVKIDQLDREVLKDARMVVIAGVASPGGAVSELRDYVRQGGQLVIAAGAEFDPAQWNDAAWLDGAGILPLPLKAQPIGKMPEEASGELRPFALSFPSMVGDEFRLADVPDSELEDLYSSPLFFKAVEADASDETLSAELKTEEKRIADERQFLTDAESRLRKWSEREARGQLTEADRQERVALEERRQQAAPDWLLWAEPQADPALAEAAPAALAERSRPRVVAAFDNQVPFLIDRSVGRGHVLFMASGLFSDWNTLPKTHAMLLVDRLLRGMLARTLPTRTLSSVEQITLPVVDRSGMYTLRRPAGGDDPAAEGPTEVLSVDALGADLYGVTINNLTSRGIYTVTAVKGDVSAEQEGTAAKLWEVKLAVNGAARESDLTAISADALADRMGDANYRWVGPGERISLAGAQIRFQDLWKWLLLLVFVGLLAEMAILARPALARERTQ